MLRTLLRAAMVAAVFATLLVPATPAAAAGWEYHLSTHAVDIVRDNGTYQLTVSATQTAEGDSVTVSLSQHKDPAGVAKAVQSHSWSWSLLGNRFVPTSDLSSATLNTRTEMGSRGKLNLTFAKNGPRLAPVCGTALKQQPGTLSGTVTFNTGTELFGQIKDVPVQGMLTRTNYTCFPDGSTFDDCPPVGHNVSGYRFGGGGMTFLSASKNETGPANIMMMRTAPLPTETPGSLSQMISAEVARSDVVISNTLATARITGGEPGTWFTGESTFAKNAPTSDPYTYPCGTNKETVTKSRQGLINGDLTAPLFVGDPITMGEDLPASAGRVGVRAAQ